MEFQWWFILVGVAVTLLIGLAIWRFFSTATEGIHALAGTTNEAIDAIKPLTSAVGHVIEGAGNVVHSAADIVQVFADSLRNKQHQRVQLASENASLHAQIEQLRGRQVNATAIERQLQVSFFSIKSKYTSFKKTSNNMDVGGLLGLERPTTREFVGIIDAHFTAKVGVDLKKLRFELKKESNVVYVIGAHEVQNIGLSDLKLEAPFTEARTIFHKTGTRAGAIGVLPEDGELLKESRLHQSEVLQEIQNSTLTSSLAEANEKVALGFFQALMGAGRYEFVSKTDASDTPLTFEQLCGEINSALSLQIDELETARASASARADYLDHEILELAIQSNIERNGFPNLAAVRE
ncbi:MAG: hypothetical protein ABIP34_11275 [Rhodoferax sp.]|uniref:hypothetical protein n=1 Tax=Rhodoferax sp. TaxID=50421 RepID=UPI003264D723